MGLVEGLQLSLKSQIEAKLKLGLRPDDLKIVDESDQHIGHAGWKEGQETHFRLYITSPLFKNMNRIQRHRMVHDLLQQEFASGLHALAIHATESEEKP
jgi:BolA protein